MFILYQKLKISSTTDQVKYLKKWEEKIVVYCEKHEVCYLTNLPNLRSLFSLATGSLALLIKDEDFSYL